MSMRRGPAGLLLAAIAGAAAAQTPPPVIAPSGPKVDAPGRLPSPEATVSDLAYDARLMSSYAAAQSFQGALDGSWTLAAADGGGDLYAFQFTDRLGVLEGAWRDLKRGHGADASGLIESASRSPPGLVLRFAPPGQAAVEVALRPDLTGELRQGQARTAVALRKSAAQLP